MIVIERVAEIPDAESLRGKEQDRFVATWEERRWVRGKFTTAAGREIGLALPTGTVLAPGAILWVERDWYLVVEGAGEPVLAIEPAGYAEAVRIAFEVGNRHFPLAMAGERLLVPDDTAMVQLLDRLGARWKRRREIFSPIGKGHSHDEGHGHTHEHSLDVRHDGPHDHSHAQSHEHPHPDAHGQRESQ